MQINLLSTVLMSTPGLMGSSPQGSLLGGLLGTPQVGTIGEFAGLLGSQGKPSDLALLNVNTPTGDIKASPQALDIAPSGEMLAGDMLPNLATYIDSPINNLKNQVSLSKDSGNTIDSKKSTVGAKILANLGKPAIANNGANIASDVVNDQEFQNALKNLEAQKQADGSIKLDDSMQVPSDGKVDDIMSKIAENLTKKAPEKNKKADSADAQIAAVAPKKSDDADKGKDAASDDLLGQFKSGEGIKGPAKAKTAESKFALETADNIQAMKHADLQHQLKDIKIDSITNNAIVSKGAAEQVEVKIAQMVKDGVDMVRIKLHPEELGKIDIQMNVDDNGKTAIRIIADKVETLDMLRKDSHSLERALRETGVKTDAGGMEFSLRNPNQNQNFAGFNDNNSPSYKGSVVSDNYLKAAKINEYTLTINPQIDGVNILA